MKLVPNIFMLHNEDKIHVRDSDTCTHQITTEAECEAAAEYNRKNNIDKNGGYGGRMSYKGFPPGCVYFPTGSNTYIFGMTWIHNQSDSQCSNKRKCICKRKACLANAQSINTPQVVLVVIKMPKTMCTTIHNR